MAESGEQAAIETTTGYEAPEILPLIISIPDTNERIEIANLMWGYPSQPISRFNKVRITNRRGIHLIEGRFDPEESRQGQERSKVACAEFVFHGVFHEPWATQLVPHKVFHTTADFLTKNGYKQVMDEPANGDLVAYGTADWPGKRHGPRGGATSHFGVFYNGQVVSKWGIHSIYKHDIDLVPSNWGSEATFYRREQQVMLPARYFKPTLQERLGAVHERLRELTH